MKQQLQDQVSQGKITQAQADARLHNFGQKPTGNFKGGNKGQGDQSRLTQEATILGLTADDLKSQLAGGKKLADIIVAKGMTQDQFNAAMKAAMEVQMKQRLQDQVSQGKITQAQADAQLLKMQNRPANGSSNNFGGRHRPNGAAK